MSLHHGFSDSDDESPDLVYDECSDPDHCDKGVRCDGEHSYSREYVRLRWGRSNFEESLDKSEVSVDKNPRSSLHASVIEVPLDEDDAPPSPVSSDSVVIAAVVAPDTSSDDSDEDVEGDSEDACSRS